MEPQKPPPSQWQRSTTRRFLSWLFSGGTLRRLLFVLAVFVTFVALLYAEENWRGRHAWNKYRGQLEAGGDQLDYRAFIPKPVPDEQNFAATPFVQSWFPKSREWTDNYWQVAGKISDMKARKNWGNHRFDDLVAWGMAFDAVRAGKLDRHQQFESDKLDPESRAKAAPAVLEGLKDSEAQFAELRTASQRPHARYPVNYDLENPWGILIPHLAQIKGAVQRLRLKACAELAVGQSERALEDVKLSFYLADSIKDEPFLISYLVRIACVQIAIQPIWEGLAEHRWSEAQLQALQSRLQQYDFITDMKRPLDGERAAGVLTADLLYRRKYRPSDLFDPSNPPDGSIVNVVGRVVPRGWYHQEQLNYCRLYHAQLRGAFDEKKKRVWPSQIAANAHELEREIAGGRLGKSLAALIHHQVIAAMLLPALGKMPLKAATAQITTDQAALACALERLRLANGQFPETLESLLPRFIAQLPKDLFTGEPYKYRRTEDGQFILYSVGWNETDDGGVPGKTLPIGFDENQGDWVWRYQAK